MVDTTFKMTHKMTPDALEKTSSQNLTIQDLSIDLLAFRVLPCAGNSGNSLAQALASSSQLRRAALLAVDVVAAEEKVTRQEGEGASQLLERVDNRRKLLEVIKDDESVLEGSDEELMNDRAFMLAAITRNPHALRLASDVLRNDPEVVISAVRLNGMALLHASDALRDDHAIVLAAVNEDGCALGCASAKTRNDKEIVLAAINKGAPNTAQQLPGIMGVGGPLHFASTELRHNRECVAAAVAQIKGESAANADAPLVAGSVADMRAELTQHWMTEVDAAVTRNAEEFLVLR